MQCACALLYCHLRLVCLYRIFPQYLINGTVFGKDVLKTKCVSWFSLQLLSEKLVLLSLRRLERDMIIDVYSLHDVKYPFNLERA